MLHKRTLCGTIIEMGVIIMKTYTTTEARKEIYSLVDQVNETHQVIKIKGKRSEAILVSEEDWQALNETIYLMSVPGMVKSIQNGLKEELEQCSDKLEW
jgi:PHD/YefM family antitoxin component YafN of YafNO toxin-antitoxin module